MSKIRELFTPLDELMVTEPSYFSGGTAVASSSTGVFSQKTPVMALDEGSRRVYGVAPEYQLICEVPNFGYSCQLAGKSVTSTAKTKKLAKHLAARAMLHEVIEKDRYSEFGIPGSTKEEAHQAVNALLCGDSSEEDPSSPGSQNENYSGKLLQLCQRKSFELPQYSVVEEGPPNDRVYTTTCKVVGQEVKGIAKQKKASKNIASQKMLEILMKGVADMNEEPSLDKLPDDEIITSTDSCPPPSSPPVSNSIKAVEEILSDTKRFDSPTQQYRILENKSAFGLTQCLLMIAFAKPGEQQRTPYVFPGEHSTEEGAKQQAARRAVLFLTS
ncbi:hypothetical protein Y032_0033g2733 [Ancylostoma ceylanicum]|uniref:DRBM domain-containing protein n=1 Tax=Ancylostoma ceylanicum TaxID=53326 RepID=A0A016UQ41_9BILA|nr:hypothetical protein Y032_0033g2733 [Ancylostoma ceylanicum]